MAIIFGYDASGNGNNWTANGLSNAPGVGNDSMVDSPTSYGTDTGLGGTVRGNYCVLNTLSRSISTNAPTPTNGNLEYATPAGVNTTGWPFVLGSIGISSGKWYFEVDITGVETDSIFAFGFAQTTIVNDSDNSDQLDKIIGAIIRNDSASTGLRSAVLGTYVTRDGADATDAVYQIAIDNDLGKLWIGKANTWYASGNPSAGTNEIGTFTSQSLIPLAMLQKNATTGDANLRYNFGQRAFAYTAPSGFKALCTQNIPPVTIGATSTTQANKYMDVTLYTGNQTVRSITNSGSMQPDFVWDKLRSGANSHRLFDAVRGVEKALYSNLSNGEATETGTLTAFNSNGFSLGTNTETNTTGSTYVAWQWNAGGSTVTNTTGTISAQVRANPTAGFSVLTYTGNGTNNETIGHGLSATPSMIIVKARNTIYNWDIYHASLGIGATLTFTNSSTRNVNAFGTSNPTPSVFYTYNNYTNTSTYTYVAYVFAAVAGYSAFGSYTGNNSTDGPFIYLGFRPKFWMVKRTDSTGDWYIYDSARSPYNAGIETLAPSQTFGESSFGSLNYFDLLSNGMKIRQDSTNGFANVLNAIYIYAAFAEHPFKYSLAR